MKKILLLGLSASLFVGPLLAAVPQQSIFSYGLVHEQVSVDTEKLAAAELVIAPDQKWSFSQKIVDVHNKGKLIQRNVDSILESKNIPVNYVTRHMASLIVAVATTASNMKKRILSKGFAAIMEGESNLTAENVKELSDAYRKSGNNLDAPFDKDMIVELLKERKNVLVQEMDDKVKKLSLDDVFIPGDLLYGVWYLFLSLGLFATTNDINTKDINDVEINPAVLMRFKLAHCGLAALVGLAASVHLYPVITHHHAIRSREQEMNYLDEVIEKLNSLDIA